METSSRRAAKRRKVTTHSTLFKHRRIEGKNGISFWQKLWVNTSLKKKKGRLIENDPLDWLRFFPSEKRREQFIKSNVCDIVNQNEKSLRQRWNELQTVSTLLIRHSNLWNSFELEDNERFDDDGDEKDNDTHTHLHCLAKQIGWGGCGGRQVRFTWIDTSMIWLKSTSDQCNETRRDKTKDNDDDDDEQVLHRHADGVCALTCFDAHIRQRTSSEKERMNDFSSLSLSLSRSLASVQIERERERRRERGKKGRRTRCSSSSSTRLINRLC